MGELNSKEVYTIKEKVKKESLRGKNGRFLSILSALAL